ncbi:hypothetical protein [Secundilactobacillus kimchicus]|nr:hypothetical protein [Secundilactobacillus kimchicus]
MNNLWKKTTLTVILHDEISDKPVKKSYGNVIQASAQTPLTRLPRA